MGNTSPIFNQNLGKSHNSLNSRTEINGFSQTHTSEGKSGVIDKIIIRPITHNDIASVKKLADENRETLGFLPLAKLSQVVEENRAMVACKNDSVIGFVLFRHRIKDLQTTLSDICINKDFRNQGIGKMLVGALLKECCIKVREFVQLKCPIDLPANNFYEKLGFSLFAIENGKKRPLKVWRLLVSSVKVEEV